MSAPVQAQSQLTEGEILQSLAGTGQAAQAVGVDVNAVRADIEARVRAAGGTNAVDTPPALQALSMLPNLTLVIQFDFNSDRIQPNSYETVARIADALHHPQLLGNKFVVVGHTDAKGARDYNLKLSQRRADAVVEALTTTFRVDPRSLVGLGVGEEQLRDPSNPDGAINRRVQLLNLGPLT
jgi:outer membrane protein OmpA-like peptidoglycan-associated protein